MPGVKRKSDTLDADVDTPKTTLADLLKDPIMGPILANRTYVPKKKARVSDASSSEGTKVTAEEVNDDEEEGDGPVWDDCNEVRRKITAHLKESNVKITPWLRELGVNSNSYQRFMKAKGPAGGAGNGMYYAAYHFFEKLRIASGKPKSKKRLQNEASNPLGFELKEHKYVWGPA